MVTTRSKAKAVTAPVSASPSPPATPIRLESPLQTPEPPTRPLKRRRNTDDHNSPVPIKLKRESPVPPESSRPRAPSWLSELVSEPDPDSSCLITSTGRDIENAEDESEDEQIPFEGPKLFAQHLTAKDWSGTDRHESLEYFQAFPHDRHSSLCVHHFLSLAEKWYWERKPTVHAQLNTMLKDGVSSKPDFSDLPLPICEDTWTIKDVKSFKGELSQRMKETRDLFIREYHRVERLTGHPPLCEIFDAVTSLAQCSKCAQARNFKPPVDDKHECHANMPPGELEIKNKHKARWVESILECGHKTPITILGTDEESSYTECEDCGHRQKVELAP
ncbi:hypothetical protein ACLX1H_007680 [Fusarium chlamydosporum]